MLIVDVRFRELDLAKRREILSLFLSDPRRLRVEMQKAKEVYEGQPLGEASEASEEVASDEDWEKLESALDEWVEVARRTGRPPPKAITRNGYVLRGRRTVRQSTGEMLIPEGTARLVLTHPLA